MYALTMAVNRQRIVHKRDRFRQLRAFCRSARLGSMARAAEQLGLSPPAVALHVREFEHELDAMLFDRGGGGVTLTAAGERLHALAGPLVDAMETLPEDFVEHVEHVEHVEDDVTGRVDVGASVAGAAIVLPPYVKRLRERYPGVRLRVRNSTLGEGLALLSAGEVEFVLGAREPLEGCALEYHQMLRYHPLAGRETVTPEEAAKWPAIVPAAGTYSRQFGESAARGFGVDVNAVLEVGGWGVIKRYVERGIGICVVPSICLHEADDVSVIRLEAHLQARSFGVYARRGKALSAPARALLGLLLPGSAQSLGTQMPVAGAHGTRGRGK